MVLQASELLDETVDIPHALPGSRTFATCPQFIAALEHIEKGSAHASKYVQ